MYQAEILSDVFTELNTPVSWIKQYKYEPMARATTFLLTHPRMVHAEFMTYRMFSRSAASSRAIPISKMIEQVMTDPVIPVYWGKAQKGMQAAEEMLGEDLMECEYNWLKARDNAVAIAQKLEALGLHKQIPNRLLEPWMWITVVCTATEYEQFFAQRCHPHAQPEIQKLAYMMRDVYRAGSPKHIREGEWSLPFVGPEDIKEASEAGHDIIKVSAGRCARVSYLTHDGRRDLSEDVRLTEDTLLKSGHWAPLEHQVTPFTRIDKDLMRSSQEAVLKDFQDFDLYSTHIGFETQEAYEFFARQKNQREHLYLQRMYQAEFCGNLRGFIPYRKMLEGENIVRPVE